MSEYDSSFREFGWDDEIQNDSTPFEVLPEGDYRFRVEKFERGRHSGSEKIPPCNKAILTLSVNDGAHSGTIQTNLFLFSRFEWKLCQLFTAIGQRRHGEAIRMNWSLVPGAIGTCHVGTRKWMGNDGKEHEGNEITEFYDPEEAPADEDAEIFAAARAWDAAEEAEQKARKRARAKWKEGLLWLLTLALMVILPNLTYWLGISEVYAVVVTVAFLITGFLLDNWHPGWMLFLTIPLYYVLIFGR